MMDMDIIYADRLFCINFIVDYLLLLITGRLCALELKRLRYVLGAVLGGAYAVLAVLPGMDFLAEGPVKLAMAAAMVLAAFGGERKLVRPALTFLAVSAALGGGIWALSMFSGGLRSTAAVVPVSLRTLVLAFALCYALVSLAFRRFGKRAERRLCRVELEFLGGRTAFQALEDSGNELTDPVSGCAVMVAERRALEAVLPELPKEADAAAILEAMRISGLKGGALMTNPIPDEYSMDPEYIEKNIGEAVEEANRLGITGKRITPFLLDRIQKLTCGASLDANIQLVLNNARLAARIAAALCGAAR